MDPATLLRDLKNRTQEVTVALEVKRTVEYLLNEVQRRYCLSVIAQREAEVKDASEALKKMKDKFAEMEIMYQKRSEHLKKEIEEAQLKSVDIAQQIYRTQNEIDSLNQENTLLREEERKISTAKELYVKISSVLM